MTILLLLPLGMYFLYFHEKISTAHDMWGTFGSYISGVYGTLAFFTLAYTTNITRIQFKKQNEDNLFFKMYQSLQDRITNSSIVLDNVTYTSHQTLKVLAEKFHEELSAQAIGIARNLLRDEPEKLERQQFTQLFEAIQSGFCSSSFNEYKEKFINDMKLEGTNERHEMLKNYIGSHGQENEHLKKVLFDIGSVNFYRICFDKRRNRYSTVVQRIYDNHGEFLDGYCKNICFLLKFIEKSIDRDTYVEFLKAQLTKYEIIILFYLVAGRNSKLGNMKYLKNFGLMDELMALECRYLMFDFPSDEDIKNELASVFDDSTSSVP